MSNTTFETVNTQWFDKDAIRLPNYSVGRVNYGSGRSYIRINQDGTLENPFRLYTSLTTAINSCAPMERPLLEWYCKLGLVEADHQLKLSQHYGSLMHLLIGEFLIGNTFDFDTLEEKVQEYLSEKNYFDPECNRWANRLKYDIASFIQFTKDYKIVPLGIEYVLLSDRGYGTLIDLVCRMTIEEKGFWGELYKSGENKGQPKETKREREIIGLVNFKSGKHGFYRSNGIQVECERLLWEENFPDLKIDAAFNWSPKEWLTWPDYNLRNWTGEIEAGEIEAILQLADIRYASKAINKKYISITGQYYSTRGLDECVVQKTAEQYCKQKYSETL